MTVAELIARLETFPPDVMVESFHVKDDEGIYVVLDRAEPLWSNQEVIGVILMGKVLA